MAREYPDVSRPQVTDRLQRTLTGGGTALLLGPPGSGKTTTARQVASEWFAENGPVLYRSGNVTRPLDGDALVDALAALHDEGTVLVVVEDATRRGGLGVVDAIDAFEGDQQVSVLLTSRTGEWERLREHAYGHDEQTAERVRRLSTLGSQPTHHRMPGLDEHEVERLRERVESATDWTVSADDATLLRRVRTGESGRSMLGLAYELLAGETDGESALQASAGEAVDAVLDPDETEIPAESRDDRTLLAELGVLTNVLNAAGIGVRREFLHALASRPADHERIESLLDALDGRVLFDRTAVPATRHRRWSERYLDIHLARAGTRQTRIQFERGARAARR